MAVRSTCLEATTISAMETSAMETGRNHVPSNEAAVQDRMAALVVVPLDVEWRLNGLQFFSNRPPGNRPSARGLQIAAPYTPYNLQFPYEEASPQPPSAAGLASKIRHAVVIPLQARIPSPLRDGVARHHLPLHPAYLRSIPPQVRREFLPGVKLPGL
jgi:hypothetical protein